VQALAGMTAVNLYLVAKAVVNARRGLPGPTFDGMAHLAGTVVGMAWYWLRPPPSASRRGGAVFQRVAPHTPARLPPPPPPGGTLV
jgi:hypothetical protein